MREKIVVFLFLVSLPFVAFAQTYSITVVKTGIGSGRVYDNGLSIDCGSVCTGTYPQELIVILFADADPGSQFYGWSEPCSGTGNCVITSGTDVTITARFGCIEDDMRMGLPCGLNGRGIETEYCIDGEWVSFCGDPDVCAIGDRECVENTFRHCEYNAGADRYEWISTECVDDLMCTQDLCHEVAGCIFDPAPQAGMLCRGVAGPCDEAEYCNGVDSTCPPDSIKMAGEVCRPSTGTCDADERCDGNSITCPPENYTSTNGLSCKDAFDYTENESCANGLCLGTEVIGSCSNAYTADTFPYTLVSTTVGRPSHLTTYGANCPVTDAPLGDAVVHVAMNAGVQYTISIVRHGGWTGFMAIIPICSILYTNATCLNQNATEDSFTYTPLLGGNATLVIESLSGTGDFTLTIEREETPQPDDPVTDDDVILPDELFPDEELPDEAVVDDVQDDIVDEEESDDATIVADDGSPLTDDTVKPDDATVITDDGTAVKDDSSAVTDEETEQPDETDDEAADELLEDNDLILSDTGISDTDKTKESGCGCSLVF